VTTFVRLGSAFDAPEVPPVLAEPTGDERRNREVLAALTALSFQIQEFAVAVRAVLERPLPAPVVNVKGEPVVLPTFPEFPSVDELASAIARAVPSPPDHMPEIVTALDDVKKALEVMGRKIVASSIMPSGGSSISRDQLQAFQDALDSAVATLSGLELSAVVSSNRFVQVLKAEPTITEEMRREETTDFDYHGLAANGTATSATTWDVVRLTKTSNVVTRIQYRTGIVWDDRASGWT